MEQFFIFKNLKHIVLLVNIACGLPEDLGELKEHTLGVNRVTENLEHLVDLVLVHIGRILLKTLNQLPYDLLQVLLVLLGQLAEEVEDVLDQVAVAEVQRVDELLKHVGLTIDQLLLEGLKQPVEPGDNDLLGFRLQVSVSHHGLVRLTDLASLN